MPDFNKLHELANNLAQLTHPANQHVGLGSWGVLVAEKWKEIVRMWNPDTFADRVNEAAAAWEETAKQCGENMEFYRGIVREIGRGFGNAAYTSDDGSIQDEVIVLKVPELVRQLHYHADRLQDENDELEQVVHSFRRNPRRRKIIAYRRRNRHSTSSIVIAACVGLLAGVTVNWFSGKGKKG